MPHSAAKNAMKKEAVDLSLKKEAKKQSIITEIARLEGEHKGAQVRLRSIEGAIQRLKADLKKCEE